MDKTKAELSGQKDIFICMCDFAVPERLTSAIRKFHHEHPHVNFNIYVNSTQYIKESLERGTLDFGVLVDSIDVEKFDYIPFKKRERCGTSCVER